MIIALAFCLALVAISAGAVYLGARIGIAAARKFSTLKVENSPVTCYKKQR